MKRKDWQFLTRKEAELHGSGMVSELKNGQWEVVPMQTAGFIIGTEKYPPMWSVKIVQGSITVQYMRIALAGKNYATGYAAFTESNPSVGVVFLHAEASMPKKALEELEKNIQQKIDWSTDKLREVVATKGGK